MAKGLFGGLKGVDAFGKVCEDVYNGILGRTELRPLL